MNDVLEAKLEANWYETAQPERPRRKRRWTVGVVLFALLMAAGAVVLFAGLAGAGEVPTCGGG